MFSILGICRRDRRQEELRGESHDKHLGEVLWVSNFEESREMARGMQRNQKMHCSSGKNCFHPILTYVGMYVIPRVGKYLIRRKSVQEKETATNRGEHLS